MGAQGACQDGAYAQIQPFGRLESAAGRRSTAIETLEIPAAPDGSTGGVGAPLRIDGDGRWEILIPIPAPFPQIARHVVKSPGVGEFQPDFMGGGAEGQRGPGVFADLQPLRIVAPEVPRGGSGAAGVLPFGLRRQPVHESLRQRAGSESPRRQGLAVPHGVVPVGLEGMVGTVDHGAGAAQD
jgi:hypothetical protein